MRGQIQGWIQSKSLITYLQYFSHLSPRKEINIVSTFHPHSGDLTSAFNVPWFVLTVDFLKLKIYKMKVQLKNLVYGGLSGSKLSAATAKSCHSSRVRSFLNELGKKMDHTKSWTFIRHEWWWRWRENTCCSLETGLFRSKGSGLAASQHEEHRHTSELHPWAPEGCNRQVSCFGRNLNTTRTTQLTATNKAIF